MNKTTSDPRKGAPSGSEYGRIVNCPGYLNLKRRKPHWPEVSSDDAASGQKVHSAYSLWEDEEDYASQLEALELTPDEEQCHDYCRLQTEKLVKELGFDADGTMQQRETRIWLEDPVISSGQVDRAYIQPKRGLIVDIKCGRDPVSPAEENYQLRLYGLLMAANWMPEDYEVIYAAIVQPWVSKVPTLVQYDAAGIKAARKELVAAMKAAADPGAWRRTGPWCKFCPGLDGSCSEALAEKEHLDIMFTPDHPAVAAALAALPNEKLAAVLDKITFTEWVIDAAKAEAKQRLRVGMEIAGWTLEEGRRIEKIVDTQKVFERAIESGVTEPEFLACTGVGKVKLAAAVREASKRRGSELKGKSLDARMDEITAGCTTLTVSDKILTKATNTQPALT